MNKAVVTNESIRALYIKHANDKCDRWKHYLFDDLKFLIFKKSKNFFSNKEDLRQEVSCAIWVAIITFDFDKNFDFFRWANWHITSAVRDYIAMESRTSFAKNSIKLNASSTSRLGDCGSYVDMNNFKLDLYSWFKKRSKKISPRDSKIIADTLFANKSLSQIASEHSITKERVGQIRKSNLNSLRSFLLY